MLARLGGLSVVVAGTGDEFRAARQLRQRAFFGLSGEDADSHDADCDHLIARDDTGTVLATCRLLRAPAIPLCAAEFHVREFVARRAYRRACEVSRFCFAPGLPGGLLTRVMFAGLAAYAAQHRVTGFFGMASLPNADHACHAAALGWLAAHHGLDIQVTSRDPAASGAGKPGATPPPLPPLLRGYLSLGARVGQGGFADTRFDTLDVFVALDLTDVPERYRRHFTRPALLAAP
ncbi:GNAT family N-acyltransferase [Cucumibacter marinus]|uniref:GNAT family N-acyltransferase n=1 Tax=Cucumibacter marinus TaxID=1121252 RepID=UPI00041EFA1F|nr:GNAT family N-acyltransferase [Cucumibacter marinus]